MSQINPLPTHPSEPIRPSEQELKAADAIWQADCDGEVNDSIPLARIIAIHTRALAPDGKTLWTAEEWEDHVRWIEEQFARIPALADCKDIFAKIALCLSTAKQAESSASKVKELEERLERAEKALKESKSRAESWEALASAEFIITPCKFPLADGGWAACMCGDWGTCHVFADTMEELAERIILHNIEHAAPTSTTKHGEYKMREKSTKGLSVWESRFWYEGETGNTYHATLKFTTSGCSLQRATDRMRRLLIENAWQFPRANIVSVIHWGDLDG